MDRLNDLNYGWLYLGLVASSGLGVLIGWLCSKPWRRT
jgi:hypothetical protein